MIYRSALISLLICAASFAQTTRPAHDPRAWEKEIQKFEATDRDKMPPPGGIVFVGSSSIRIWKTAEAFPGKNVINRGFGGSFGSDSIYYADRIVVPYKPRVVVFYGGENDIAAGVTTKDAAKGVTDFIETIRAKLPDAKIVIIGLKPNILRWKLHDQFREANSIIRSSIEGKPNVVFVDVEKVMLAENGRPRPDIFRADGLHMNEKGYELWNPLIKPYVIEAE